MTFKIKDNVIDRIVILHIRKVKVDKDNNRFVLIIKKLEIVIDRIVNLNMFKEEIKVKEDNNSSDNNSKRFKIIIHKEEEEIDHKKRCVVTEHKTKNVDLEINAGLVMAVTEEVVEVV